MPLKNWSPTSARGLCRLNLGYDYQFSKDNLAYLKSWVKVLKNDKRAIFKACPEAQRAFDYLMTFQTERKEAA